MGGTMTQSGTLKGSLKATGNLTGTIRPQGVLKGTISKPLIVGDNETVYILKDDAGNELVGVLTDVKPVLDATANDIRKGVTAVTEEGITEGTKVIPSYNTYEGYKLITPGKEFIILLEVQDIYDYTKLQCIICPINKTVSDSVAAEKVVINDNVYEVRSTESISSVTKDSTTKSIKFGIVNDTDKLYLIRYFTYKEIY